MTERMVMLDAAMQARARERTWTHPRQRIAFCSPPATRLRLLVEHLQLNEQENNSTVHTVIYYILSIMSTIR